MIAGAMSRLFPILVLLLAVLGCTSTEPAVTSKAPTQPPATPTASNPPVFPGTRTPPPTATATAALEVLVLPTSTQPPAGLLAFAAGGSVYTVRADGSGLTQVVAGSRNGDEVAGRQKWASSPELSPDGRQIVFARDFDAWLVSSVGGQAHFLASIGSRQPAACPTCASSWTLGASNFAWSPDGGQILYVINRVGGSGASAAGLIDVSTGEVTPFPQAPIYGAGFLYGLWLRDGPQKLWSGWEFIDLDANYEAQVGTTLVRNSRPGTIKQASGVIWVAGSWVGSEPILVLTRDELAQPPAIGVSPAISPDGDWIAYFDDESLRIVRIDGRDDHELVDLTPLGGRDRHFASQPDCYPGNAPACSYRPPLISWTRAP